MRPVLGVAVALCLGLAGHASAQSEVYDAVETGLWDFDHRLPGSTNLWSAIDLIESQLRAAGLEPRRQRFGTLAQRTDFCRLTVDGQLVEPVYAVDNGVAPQITETPIEGRLVYGGAGTLDCLEGKSLEGAVVLLDADHPRIDVSEVFMHGAQAVILMGSDRATQWSLSSVSFDGPTWIPRVYIDKDTAEEYNLLEAEGRTVSLEMRVTLEDVETANLWVAIPGKEGWTADLGSEEALILSTVLDTYGFTPDRNPRLRGVANAALLADVLVHLAERPLNRTVIGVFFGSHYAAQDGARHFYYAVDMSDKSIHREDIGFRIERLGEERLRMQGLMEAAHRDDLLETTDDMGRGVINLLRQLLAGRVNNTNAELQDIRLERARLERALDDEETTASERGGIPSRLKALEHRVEKLNSVKYGWNALRDQILARKLQKHDAENMVVYAEVIGAIRGDLEQRIGEIDREISWLRTSEPISEVFENREVIGHFDFDFANDSDPWMLSMINSFWPYRNEVPDVGSYLTHLSRMAQVYDGVAETEWSAPLLREALNPFYKPASLSLPGMRTAPSSVSVALGMAGFQMMTVGDPLDADPLPVRREVDLRGLVPQMRVLGEALANDPALSLRRIYQRERLEDRLTYLYRRGELYDGTQFINYSRSSSDREGPAANAIVVLRGSHANARPVGSSELPRIRTTRNGYVFFPLIARSSARNWWFRTNAFGFDSVGLIDRYVLESQAIAMRSARVPLFYGFGGASFSYGYSPDPLGGDLYQPRTLIARNDAEHRNRANIRLASPLSGYFADRSDPIKRIGGRGELILGSTADDPMGVGVPMGWRELLNFNGVAQGANDYWVLNESRLSNLRARNIINDALESLHADVREHLDRAADAAAEARHGLARAHHVFATSIANRVYAPLRGITDDLVHAVVVLLLLSIPFAFAMERLIFGFTSIYRQVLGFMGFFLTTFLLLYVTHPAFALAEAPIVIFLAFVIILLSAITVYLVMSKIKLEIRAIQGLASTVHGVESDSSTALAAVMIGISGMRNRPLKTMLTSLTVVLLTFTILVFASFTAQYGVVETYLGRGQDENRIEMHRFSYLDIDKSLLASLDQLLRDDYHVFMRGGLFRNPTMPGHSGITPTAPDRVIYNPRTRSIIAMGAVVGLDPAESAHYAKMQSFVPGFDSYEGDLPPIYLPPASAAALDAVPGDTLLINGQPFSFVGVHDGQVLMSMSTLSETRIVPPDFTETIRNIGGRATDGASMQQLEDLDVGSFEWFSSERIAVSRMDALLDLYQDNAFVNFVTLYPRRDDVDLEETARMLAPVFQGAVQVKSAEGAKRMFFTRAVRGSGFADVIVPLILGGLIIFSSLMGSIVDREREIFTYSALGLSPPDVGALFFAESCVYSVVGGMGGYLLSQVVAKVLNVLSARGIFRAPEMNFSSLSSVLTILVVMAVVVLSTVYPAIKAGKSANPGIARKWRMPAPVGDRLRFVFPFTVSKSDFAGILSFVREHFENHSDATLGSFAARDISLFRQPASEGASEESMGIAANVSLAPFDLGIFQKFKMFSQEFEIAGIEEVVVELERVGGTPGAWVRGNRGFADELRRQFLLWRSLPIETIEHYRRQTRMELGGQESEASRNGGTLADRGGNGEESSGAA